MANPSDRTGYPLTDVRKPLLDISDIVRQMKQQATAMGADPAVKAVASGVNAMAPLPPALRFGLASTAFSMPILKGLADRHLADLLDRTEGVLRQTLSNDFERRFQGKLDDSNNDIGITNDLENELRGQIGLIDRTLAQLHETRQTRALNSDQLDAVMGNLSYTKTIYGSYLSDVQATAAQRDGKLKRGEAGLLQSLGAQRSPRGGRVLLDFGLGPDLARAPRTYY